MSETNDNVNAQRPSTSRPQDDANLHEELDQAMGGQNMEQLLSDAAEPVQEPAADDDSDPQEKPHIEMQLRRGRISAIQGDDVFVELSGMDGKNQGMLPLAQFERPPRIGSIMDFVVVREDEAEGLVILSREGAISRATWSQLAPGASVEARVVSVNKGGLELEMVGGIPAFMPASQVDLHYTGDLEQFVGQKIQARVQEINHKSKKVVLSRRQFLEHERQSKRRRLWAELEVGQVRDGVISSLMEYGAFADIGGLDGLIHVSDLSYTHVKNPSEVVQVGQAVKVKVLKLDPEKQRVSLGLKQVAPDPWDGLESRLSVGDQISARVVRVADFGAFVEIEPGIEGLLPVSEMSWRRIDKPSDVVREGDVVRMAVLSIDLPKRRISLSLKQSQGDPWAEASDKYPRNALVDAKVTSIADFGAFVELEPGIEGLVHISELSDRRVNAVEDVLKVGDSKQFRVLEIDKEHHRVRLSLKAATHDPSPARQPTTPAKPAPPQRRKPTRPLKGGIE